MYVLGTLPEKVWRMEQQSLSLRPGFWVCNRNVAALVVTNLTLLLCIQFGKVTKLKYGCMELSVVD